MIIAIDGPAGAGKSSVARRVAERLGMSYLDTGAMYRAVAWLARRRGVDLDDAAAAGRLAREHQVELYATPAGPAVAIAGYEVTDELRRAEMSDAASRIAVHPEVRRAVVATQQALMRRGDWVADGRDVGTVIAPQAEVKIFLDAHLAVRAERRLADLRAAGRAIELERVLDDLRERDERDRRRAAAPLAAATDAVLLDSTDLTEDEVVARVAEIAAAAGGRAGGAR